MEKRLFIQTGFGVDVHGQNITKAAKRAVRHAIYHNSMAGIEAMLPGHDLNQMVVNVKLAIPIDKEKLDHDAIKSLIPYGTVTIEIVDGGMLTTSGIFLADKNDVNDLMYIVNASVETGY
ncbi:Lin0512 family protein [Listeria sp. PSOL-1]|uniref:Lin0512 family protein n=1 Tax=Listeria sp. PSOL-1 TaxID=1844999 RepID=UPI0013D56027|nr:Lin0512 family protein [Listeria sp. PSOL-1]